MQYLAIEGVIGSGKSTLLAYLDQHFSSKLKCFSEPLDLYSHFLSHNPIQRSYASPRTDASIAQLHIIETSKKFYSKSVLFKNIQETDQCLLITERSALSPFFFIKSGYMSEIYSDFVYDYLMKKCSDSILSPDVVVPSVTIILDLDLGECNQRIRKRERVGEENISLEYQENLRKNMLNLANLTPNCKILPIKPSDSVETVAEKLFHLLGFKTDFPEGEKNDSNLTAEAHDNSNLA